MKENPGTRWIQLAIAAALIADLALMGLGLPLLSTQSRHLRKVLFNAAVDTAEVRIVPKILEAISAVEAQSLEALVAASAQIPMGDDQALLSLRQKYHAIESPFLLASDLTFLYPRPRSEPAAAPLLEPNYESAPEDFQNAMKLLWGGAPHEEARRALEAVYRAPELAARWRLRALSAAASLDLRRGQAAEAAELYRQLFQEFSRELHEASWPSALQLTLAHAQALERAGREEQARNVLKEAFRKLIDGELASGGPEEEEYFVSHFIQWFQPPEASRAPVAAPPEPAEVQGYLQLYQERNRNLQLSSALCDWIATRIRLSRAAGEASSGPQRFSENFAGARYLIVWRSEVELPTGSKLAAVGFRFNPEVLREIIEEAIYRSNRAPEAEEAGPLQFRIFNPLEDAGELPAAALPPPLQFLRLGVEGESWNCYLKDNRRPFQIAAVLIPALGAGMALALIAFYRAYRRERFLSQMKTDFVANVSHELKTPLALIRLFGETLLLDRVSEADKQKEYYRIIVRESERLTHLINNVLNFASIEAGRKTYDLRPTDLAKVVRETLSAYQLELDQRGFQLRAEIAAGLPPVAADPDGIAQALINLLNNAVKYSPEEKRIEVRLWPENGSLHLSVSDRGVGIAPADQKRIFEGFYRSEAARKLGSRGSGLGLPLVQHLVRSHGGRVEIASAPGKGSTFTLIFPCREARQAKMEPTIEIHEED